jgi:hypothetical protein
MVSGIEERGAGGAATIVNAGAQEGGGFIFVNVQSVPYIRITVRGRHGPFLVRSAARRSYACSN